MNTEQIIKLAREAGIEWQENSSMSGKKRMSTAGSQSIERIEHFAALVTQAERESRQAAQAENEQLKARLARSGVELRKAVRDEREACKAVCTAVAAEFGGVAEGRFVTDFGKHTHQAMAAGALNCVAAIEARNQAPDSTDCDCADNEPCKRTAPGLALESGEFVPAEKIADWAAA